jgi:hypothetical protein
LSNNHIIPLKYYLQEEFNMFPDRLLFKQLLNTNQYKDQLLQDQQLEKFKKSQSKELFNMKSQFITKHQLFIQENNLNMCNKFQ